jgi:hypothetical protein
MHAKSTVVLEERQRNLVAIREYGWGGEAGAVHGNLRRDVASSEATRVSVPPDERVPRPFDELFPRRRWPRRQRALHGHYDPRDGHLCKDRATRRGAAEGCVGLRGCNAEKHGRSWKTVDVKLSHVHIILWQSMGVYVSPYTDVHQDDAYVCGLC